MNLCQINYKFFEVTFAPAKIVQTVFTSANWDFGRICSRRLIVKECDLVLHKGLLCHLKTKKMNEFPERHIFSTFLWFPISNERRFCQCHCSFHSKQLDALQFHMKNRKKNPEYIFNCNSNHKITWNWHQIRH